MPFLVDEIVSNSFSATTSVSATTVAAVVLSGGTLFSGNTELSSVFMPAGTAVRSIIQGTNIATGGTAAFPIISTSLNPIFTSLIAATLSGATIYSGSTDIDSIFHRKNGYLLQKSGHLSGDTFSGDPQTSVVIFQTPFPDNLYSVHVTGDVPRINTVFNKSYSGFTINTNDNIVLSAEMFYWIAVQCGEGYK